MEPRWEKSIWLGKSQRSNEHVVAVCTGGIHKGRDIRLLPVIDAWKVDNFAAVVGVPWDPQRGVERTILRTPAVTGADADVRDRAVGAKHRVHLTRTDIEKYGHTPGCARCRGLIEHRHQHAVHSAECRNRIEDAMMRDSAQRERVVAARARTGTDITGVDEPYSQQLPSRVSESESRVASVPTTTARSSVEVDDDIPKPVAVGRLKRRFDRAEEPEVFSPVAPKRCRPREDSFQDDDVNLEANGDDVVMGGECGCCQHQRR